MPMLIRRPDWPQRLNRVIEHHRAAQFRWGEYDCGTLFSDVVYAMTDWDPMEPMGRWYSEATAMRALLGTGHRTMQAYVAGILDEVPPSMARRGDVGFTSGCGPLSCPAIVVGAEAVSRDTKDWMIVPASQLMTAYRIG